MMKLIVLAGLIAIATAATTRLGGKRCTWGPSYWCGKYSHAIECNAVEHCKANVWKSSIKSSECDTCKEVLQYMHSILADNVTQGLLIDSLEEICNLLPSSYEAECKSLLTTYGTEIIQVIAAYSANPNEVCDLLGMCKASSVPLVRMTGTRDISLLSRLPIMGPGPVIPQPQIPSGSAECIVCEFAMDKLESIITSKSTAAEIEAALDKVCDILPTTVRNTCTAVVNTYATQILNLLIKEASPKEVCTLLHLCSAEISALKVEKHLPEKSFVGAGEFCEVCQLAMGYLKSQLSNNATEQEMEQLLESVCNYLPSSLKTECDSLVETYSKMIIKLLLAELSPDLVCKELGLCTSTGVKVFTSVLKESKPKVNAGEFCEVCQLAMGYLKSQLSNNATEQEMEQLLESVCNYLPSSLKTECDSLVETYSKMIIKLLLAELSPDLVCKELGLCTSSGVKVIALKTPIKESGEFCQICQIAMGFVKSELTQSSTETEIVNLLDTVCSYIPSGFKTECTALVNEYGKEIITLLLSEFNPDSICKELTLCTATGVTTLISKVPVAKVSRPEAGEFCQICELAMGYLKSTLVTNATEQEIISALETVCNELPSSFKSECNSLIETYGKQIIKSILDGFTPDVICKELGLCKGVSAKKSRMFAKHILSKFSIKSAAFCEVCELAMGYLKSSLSSPATEEEITKAVETLCLALPSSIQTECDALIGQYGKMIINLIVSELTPDQVCKTLGLCASTKLVLF